MPRIFRLLLLVLTLWLPGLAVAQDNGGPSGPITAQQSPQQDAEIGVRIREILRELGNYEDITVTVSEGVVTLRGTTNSLAEAEALGVLASRVEGVVAVKNEARETADIVRRLDPAMDRFRARVDSLLIQLPLALIAFGVFFLISFLGGRLARLSYPWDRMAPNAFIADLIRTVVRIVFVVAGLVIALDIMNATALLSTILGAAGLIGLAIGFAVRDTVENFIASVMLSIRQPFAPNDVVEINGDEGKVIRLTSRATILLSFDGNHIRIPNSTVFSSRIVNYSQNRERRFLFKIGIDEKSDMSAARELAETTVRELPFVLPHPAASTWIGEVNDGGIEIVVTGWINQRDTSILQARGEALRQVLHALDVAGIPTQNTTYVVQLNGPVEDGAAKPAATPVARADRPAESFEVAQVSAVAEAELDHLVEQERADDQRQDLLREDAAKE